MARRSRATHAPSDDMLLPAGARIDGKPRRSVTSANVRHVDKSLLDLMQKWWSVRLGRVLTQWDTMSIALRLAAENPRAGLPPEVVEAFRRASSSGEDSS